MFKCSMTVNDPFAQREKKATAQRIREFVGGSCSSVQ